MPTTPATTSTTAIHDPAQVQRAEIMLAALREANPKHRFARTRSGNAVGIWLAEPGVWSICCLWLVSQGVQGWVGVSATRDLPNIDPGIPPADWIE